MTSIEADPEVPVIRITRDFQATPEQLFRAHTDPELFRQWVGPDGMRTQIDYWDARSGGSFRFVSARDGEEFGFRGCFHDVRPDRIVQTFTYEGAPDGVALETLWFEDLGDGRTRLHAQSLVDSFEERDAWLRSGMETGVTQGYAKLDRLLADGTPSEIAADVASGVADGAAGDQPAARHRRIAARFTRTVHGVKDWEGPSPVAGWTARDVVRHLVEWFPPFLAAGTGIELTGGPAVDDDPVAAWETQCAAVQAILDDPATPERTLVNRHIGTTPLDQAIDRFYTSDVFMHAWDLSRATGQDDRLDPDECAALLAGMEPIEELLRSSGQFGPGVPVPADADAQTRLVGFIGRDPTWLPA